MEWIQKAIKEGRIRDVKVTHGINLRQTFSAEDDTVEKLARWIWKMGYEEIVINAL